MVPITQQHQTPDGNYLPEVNVILQDTGNVLVSDSGHEVLVVDTAPPNPFDEM
jgi:hypothetical protein